MNPDAKLEGWKAIAAAVRLSIKSARRLAERNIDPLPVRHGPIGAWTFVEAVRAWVHRQDLDFAKHVARDRLKKRPHLSPRASKAQGKACDKNAH